MKKRIVLVSAAVVAVVALLGAGVWFAGAGGPGGKVVSAEGGFALEVPEGWTVKHRHPMRADRSEFISGHETVFGMQRGGFWVSRWSVPETTTLNSVQQRMRAEDAANRTEVKVGEARLAGRPAAMVTYNKKSGGIAGSMRAQDVTIREIVVDRHIYQVGIWTLRQPGSLLQELEAVVNSFELRTPQPWRETLRDSTASVEMPPAWVERKPDLKDSIFHAIAPGDPTDAWVYVFRSPDPAAKVLATSKRDIVANGGTLGAESTATLDGRDAKRLEFEFPDPNGTVADDVSFYVDDPKGGSFVLTVGRRTGSESIADRIARTWRFA